MMPPFTYVHAGRGGWADGVRYRLKECWILLLVLVPLALRGHGTVMVHNSITRNRRFTDDFIARRAGPAGVAPDMVLDAFGRALWWRGLAALLAVPLAALPRGALVALARTFLAGRARRLDEVVQFFDAHLSGFVLALALKRLGVRTATLQHGLYLASDRGSMMGLRNFVSDRVFLWDPFTEAEFRTAGHDPARLIRTGQYGFCDRAVGRAQGSTRIALCPSYHPEDVALFRTIAAGLPGDSDLVFSLHPLLRTRFKDLAPVPIAEMTVPRVAICGDSGAILDCLSRGIPVITVAERALTEVHLGPAEAETLSPAGWARLLEAAPTALQRDRVTFGFAASDGPAARDDVRRTG